MSLYVHWKMQVAENPSRDDLLSIEAAIRKKRATARRKGGPCDIQVAAEEAVIHLTWTNPVMHASVWKWCKLALKEVWSHWALSTEGAAAVETTKTKTGDAAQEAVGRDAGELAVPKAKKAKAVAITKPAKDAQAVDPTARTPQQEGADNVSVEGKRARHAGKPSAGNLGSAASSGSAPSVPQTVPSAAPGAVMGERSGGQAPPSPRFRTIPSAAPGVVMGAESGSQAPPSPGFRAPPSPVGYASPFTPFVKDGAQGALNLSFIGGAAAKKLPLLAAKVCRQQTQVAGQVEMAYKRQFAENLDIPSIHVDRLRNASYSLLAAHRRTDGRKVVVKAYRNDASFLIHQFLQEVAGIDDIVLYFTPHGPRLEFADSRCCPAFQISGLHQNPDDIIVGDAG